MILLCLALILIAFAISCPLTWVLIGLGNRMGQLDIPDAPGGRKSHAAPIPNTGGVAIFLGVALPITIGLSLAWMTSETSSLWSGSLAPAAAHLKGVREQTPMILAVLVGLLVFHVMGLIDDRKRLGPFSKLFVQLAVAGVLAGFFHVRILDFLEHYGPLGFAASVLISVLWMVAITNSMNFLDNMDGLSSGIGIVCGVMYLAATLINGQWFVAGLAALLVGSLLGFLCFNFPPAKVFMGDGGSLVLGLTLSIISIRTTYLPPGASLEGGAAPGRWYALLMPLLVLAVPIYDLTSVTIIRLMQGKSPFVGDQQHFSHRLVKKGLSKRAAVIVIWLCSLATGLGGVMLSQLEAWQAALVAVQCAAVILVLALLERTKPAA